jgi:PAS domain S-box-containing protein
MYGFVGADIDRSRNPSHQRSPLLINSPWCTLMTKKFDPTDQNRTKEQLISALAVVRSEMANLSKKLKHLKTKKIDLSVGEIELWLRSIINQAPGALAMFDRQMRYLGVSRRWLSDYNIGERDLVGLSHYDIFPEIPDYWKNIHRRALEGEVLRAEEDRFERADGSVQYLRWEVRPWQISSGDIGGIIIYSEDITERKRMEETIRASETEMRALFAAMTDVVFVSNSEGRFLKIVDTNPSLLYKPPEELLGKTLHDVFPRKQADFFLSRLKKALRTQQPVNFEYSLLIGDKEFWFNATVSPMPNEKTLMVARDITQRKQAEQEIEQSRTRIAWILEQVGIGTWFNEFPFRHLNWDKKTRELFFVSPDAQPTIELFWNHLHEGDHEPTQKAVEEAIRNQTTYSIEHRAVNAKTGEVRWIRSIGKASYSEDGTPTRFDGINYDITNYKQVEEALRASESQYRRLVETSNEGIWVIDNENHTSFVNKRMAEMLGCTVQEMSDSSLFDFMDSDAEAVASSNVERRRQGIAEQHDFEFRRKDGSHFWGLVSTNPIHDESGRYLGALAMITDITDRKRTEEALRASEQRLHLALDSAYLILFEWDIARNEVRRFVSKDPALAPTSGRSGTLEELLNMVHPEDREQFTANVFAPMQQNEARYENEFRIIHPDGKVRWLHETGYFEYDLHNRPIRLIGLSQDITDQKMAELELLQFNEKLDQQVIERTALANARSKQLQALAVELIEAEEKERYRISGLLHEDLQQLLAAARFKLESKCRSDPDLKQVQQLLEESISKARHMSHELSPMVLHHSGLTAAIKWLCLNFREQFGLVIELEAQTSMQVESAPSKVFIFRAIQELLLNIVKHAGVDTAKVKIAKSGDDLVIMVSDSGKGFETSTMEAYTARTGLGLMSLRERASYVGGSLTIESAPGKGSRFILRVPIKMAGTAHPCAPETQVEDKTRHPAQTAPSAAEQGIRVLFADDHKVMRQGLIRLVAGKPGILVVGEASNGREALEKVRLIKPDVVVMDISMPEMGGIEATRHIKTELPDVRVIGLSMHEDEHIAQVMREAGAEASLSKTTSSAKLLKAIYGNDSSVQDIPPLERR